ncbi:tripartite tricarboxylate transporter substrate binding protein [Devosia rhodophyticola]|uniref:Tripartite tricarboxylate transporter substrate binding protein n=1 Tax=Devosia rhodophyticola TaxID=3026423 RepID=A0ABY7YYT3_9HYPH|nr:tripartite tricarboxylate transporter substrate binding protein [Devosia rhodophyticola]WDR06175.1 tripartite tricarboxylate transporter substrate binding protein [Devosia rhodophyticola]
MKFVQAFGAALALSTILAGTAIAAEYSWKPDKPVTIIVPWSAGGSTDSVTRVLAGELEDALGQTVVVVNQPGAAGSVGTTGAWEAPHDGMTWGAGAALDLGSYQVLGMLDVPLTDWEVYLHIANVAVVGANPDAGYADFGELLEAMKANPGEISVATAGVTSGGHNAMESIAQTAGVEYRHVSYDGGNPAVLATVSGETAITTQLASEQAEMIRAGRIIPLAVLSDKPLNIEGFGEVPSIKQWIPEIKTAANYFGIWVPKDSPPEVIETMNAIWADKIANSAAMKEYAGQRGAILDPSSGDAAVAAAMPALTQNVWLMFDGGKTENDPADFGFERP